MLAHGGGSVKKSGVYDEICRYLKDAGKEIVDLPGVMPDPTYKKVQEGAALAKEKGVDLIYLFCHHKKHRLPDIFYYIRESAINIALCLQSATCYAGGGEML